MGILAYSDLLDLNALLMTQVDSLHLEIRQVLPGFTQMLISGHCPPPLVRRRCPLKRGNYTYHPLMLVGNNQECAGTMYRNSLVFRSIQCLFGVSFFVFDNKGLTGMLKSQKLVRQQERRWKMFLENPYIVPFHFMVH